MSNKNIIFTGGGSGGHVIPAITLINKLKSKNISIFYIGGRDSIEERIAKENNLEFKAVSNGKLRRYISVENIKDIFKVVFGVIESFFYLLKFSRKDSLVFSTGGFVSVPIILAAALQGKKIYIHEQTTRVGLANKIASKFAHKVFVSFKDSLSFFPASKVKYSGYPVRDEIFDSKIGPVNLNGININEVKKEILFITGGGNGSFLLNEFVKSNQNSLKDYFVIHQVGKKFLSEYEKLNSDQYIAVDFLGSEMVDILKLAKYVISRSGAGTVSELLALKKKSVFIPLKIAQKNEQYHNAMAANKEIGSIVVKEDDLSSFTMTDLISKLNESTVDSEFKYENGTDYLIKEIVGTN